jgi:carboxyl-terminal processing protease
MRKYLNTWCSAALAAFLLVAGCKSPPIATRKANGNHSAVPLAAETFDKVWQIINEYHFDTNFSGLDWNAMREKYRPRAINARSTEQFHEAIQEMLDRLKVSHLAIVPGDLAEIVEEEQEQLQEADEDGPGNPGLTLRVMGTRAIVTAVWPGSFAADAGVKPGWIIQKVKAVQIEPQLKKLRKKSSPKLYGFLGWKMVNALITGAPGSQVPIQFLNDRDQVLQLSLERQQLPGTPVQMGSLPELYANVESEWLQPSNGLKIGLIRFNIWMLPSAIAFDKALHEFRSADGIVLDLRGNIGGIAGMVMGVAGHFIKEPVSLGTMKMRENTIIFPANPRRVTSAGERVEPYAGPLAILVDEISVSASELFAGSMQELGRARIFGRRTTGQALPAIHDKLPNGDVLYHPLGDFITGKGGRIEAHGVIPDVEIPLKRSDLLSGKDIPLDAAVAWISAQKEHP